ncbi:unnamed protein product [Cercopithifilaria johnstoni]|uniref:Uncharacterized protein n=1 Tax=Cercopithifilaria johnstoni TaxID=2874296 RepID=A0A8J2LVD7_9BILA|nr:unnamed protein product [Cercopithifilaria johnstoni]
MITFLILAKGEHQQWAKEKEPQQSMEDIVRRLFNEQLNTESLDKLIKELGNKRHSDIHFHQFVITDRNSCENFASYLKKEHNGLDALINNAGFAFKHAATESPEEQARVTIAINYNGTKQVSNILFPLIRDDGRVVDVSNLEGAIDESYNDETIAEVAEKFIPI